MNSLNYARKELQLVLFLIAKAQSGEAEMLGTLRVWKVRRRVWKLWRRV